MICVTQRYEFPAAHVLSSPDLTPAENQRIYGKCANPSGHGHNYGLEVTVGGEVDPGSGHIIEPDVMDEIYDEVVAQRYSHRMLNDLEAFAQRVPTAENIAELLYAELSDALNRRSRAHLVRVRLVETSKNHFECGALL